MNRYILANTGKISTSESKQKLRNMKYKDLCVGESE